MNILFVGRRDPAHSLYGGYDKIALMPQSRLLSSERMPFYKIPLGDINKMYRFPLFYRLLRRINLLIPDVLSHFYRWKYDITHLYYGDRMISFWPYMKSKSHKIVITIHLDIHRHRNPKLFISALRRFDGIIVLSSEQCKYLNDNYNLDAIFIPHGFIKPKFIEKIPVAVDGNKINANDINIFVAGSNYRDIETLKDVIKHVDNMGHSLYFHLVGIDRKIRNILNEYHFVRVYNRLSDDEYFTLLSLCYYNFLPLLFATANNTLLEAQFCGVTSILPYIGGIEDYAAPSPLNIFYKSREDLFVILPKLSKQEKKVEIMKYAEQFEWNNVWNLLNDYYKKVLDKGIAQ